ncbi:MAG TPA: M28 family peptidase [Polyangia bacterium]
MKHAALASLMLATSFGCSNAPPKATDPNAILGTLNDLATFGNKHVGTDPGRQAGEYVFSQMQKLGLADVHMESWQFPRHVVDSQTFTATVAGSAMSPTFEVFEGSGAGHADADVVYCGKAHPEEVAAVNLQGKIALLDRDMSYHRSAQYENVAAAGAVAMLYNSAADGDLIQVGSVRFDGWSPLGPIPAVTIGNADGQVLESAVAAGQTVHAVIDVQAHAEPASGSNVIGRIEGSENGMLVLGAHYDTWFTGSCDNGGGIAALLAIAKRRMNEGKPRYTLVFVGYDGEEVALYGGYDYLRKHRIVAHDPILAVLNFEMPSAIMSSLLGLARSNFPALDTALQTANLGIDYPLYAGMEYVPQIFGGIIPTDIQGIYRNGVPTASTAVDSPWYHTVEDTPDKVDIAAEAQDVDDFDKALGYLLADDASQFAGLDDKLWQATLAEEPRSDGDPLVVDIAVADAMNVPQANAPVQAYLMVDDFFLAGSANTMTDANGHATVTFDAAAAAMGAGNRYIHVTSGPTYPYVEQILALP